MSVEIKKLDHLGLVVGIIDEIGIVNKINELIEENYTEKITVEKVVKAMILNSMGLVSSPLYSSSIYCWKGSGTFTRGGSKNRVFERL